MDTSYILSMKAQGQTKDEEKKNWKENEMDCIEGEDA